MKLSEVAEIRTGAVIARMRTQANGSQNKYRLISLRCVSDDGIIVTRNIEEVELPVGLKEEWIAKNGDIIVKLSTPYSAAIIHQDEIGCLIPSHFAIIRADKKKVYPPFLLGLLNSDYVKKQIIQNNSGSTVFGTIGSGFFADLEINSVDMDEQQLLGDYVLLSMREKVLTEELVALKAIYNNYITKKLYEGIRRR